MADRIVAEWASRKGNYWVHVSQAPTGAYYYTANAFSTSLRGEVLNDAQAISYIEDRIELFQPKRNRTPMKRKDIPGGYRLEYGTVRALYTATLEEVEDDGDKTQRWAITRTPVGEGTQECGSVAFFCGFGDYTSSAYGLSWTTDENIPRGVAEAFEEHFPTEADVRKNPNRY